LSQVEIRDHAVWIKHIHGNESLSTMLTTLSAGDLIELRVDGFRGMWKKMEDGGDGRPTAGIKGLGTAKDHWHGLQEKRGDLVSIEFVSSVT
jgi:hypothetical protein